MYNKLSPLLDDESTIDTINNESGGRLCYKYPDETLSFQSAELQSVLSDITHDSTFSNDKRPCKYPVDASVASLHELNSVLSFGTYSEPCFTITSSENSKTYDSSYTTSTIEDSTKNNFEYISYHKKSTTNIHHLNKSNIKKTSKSFTSANSHIHINNIFQNVNKKETSKLRGLQKKFCQGTHSGCVESAFEPKQMPIDLAENHNSTLMHNSLKESLLQDYSQSRENDYSYSENKNAKLYVHKKVNNTDSLNSTNNLADSIYLRTTLSNDSAYIQPLHSETDCTKHSKTDLNVLSTIAKEVQRNGMNNLHLIPEPDDEGTDIIRDDDNIFLSNDPVGCCINVTEDVTNRLFSDSELNYSSNVEMKTIQQKNSVTQKCVQSLFRMKSTENEELNLPNELTSNVKDSDKITAGKGNREVSEPLIAHSVDIFLSGDSKNKQFQKCEETNIKFISDRSLTLVSNNINKVTNFITHIEHAAETVRNMPTERPVQYSQEKTKISRTKKHINNNRPAEIRKVLRSAQANKESMQPSFHPLCNNHIVNDNINTRMSKNKSRSNKYSFKYNIVNSDLIPEPLGNVTEGMNQAIEKTKITNQSTNMCESEHFILKGKNKKQCTSELLTTEDKKNLRSENSSQNCVKCMCNKTFTINCNKSRNHLDNEVHKSKHYDFSLFPTTAISDADSSEVSKLGESNSEGCHLSNSETNKLKNHDTVNYCVMSQANSFVNEERKKSRKLSLSKRNDRMYTKNKSCNPKLVEDLRAAYYNRMHSGKHEKVLADLGKHLFDDSFYENEIEDEELKLNIPFSELQTNRSLLIQIENPSINLVNLNNNNKSGKRTENTMQVNKSRGKPIKHTAWQTKCLTKYLFSKLGPVYGVESKIICEKLIQFLSEKIKETIQNNINFHIPVNEIKIELAKLNIIETNMDFYLFVMKFFRAYEKDFVYKCVPCIRTFGRPNLLPRPSNGHLNKRIEIK